MGTASTRGKRFAAFARRLEDVTDVQLDMACQAQRHRTAVAAAAVLLATTTVAPAIGNVLVAGEREAKERPGRPKRTSGDRARATPTCRWGPQHQASRQRPIPIRSRPGDNPQRSSSSVGTGRRPRSR